MGFDWVEIGSVTPKAQVGHPFRSPDVIYGTLDLVGAAGRWQGGGRNDVHEPGTPVAAKSAYELNEGDEVRRRV